MLALLLLLAGPDQGTEVPPVVLAGADHRGVVSPDSAPVHTEELDEGYLVEQIHAQRLLLRVTESGVHSVHLRALPFDSYLVLRDAEGQVLAENDDYSGLDAALEHSFGAPGDFLLEVCALRDGSGEYQLQFRRSGLPQFEAAELRAMDFRDAGSRLEWVEKEYGTQHLEYALALERVAKLHFEDGEAELARPLLHNALTLREAQQDDSAYRLGLCRYRLARCLRRLGELEGARDLFQTALRSFILSRGAADSWTAACIGALADTHTALGDFSAAADLYQQVLPGLESIVEQDPVGVATHLNNFALLLVSMGEYAQSRVHLERCLQLQRHNLSPDDLRIAATLNNLATLFLHQDLEERAREFYLQALGIRVRVLGEDHPETAQSYSNLAILDQQSGRFQQARAGFDRAAAIYRQAYGNDDHRTAEALTGLAELDLDNGRLPAALAAYQESLRIRRQVFGPAHPRSLGSLRGVAAVYRAQGRLGDSLTLLDQALELETGQRVREQVGLPALLLERAMVLADMARPDDAWNAVAAALRVNRERLLRGLGGLSETERLQTLAAMKWSLELMCSLAAESGNETVHSATLAAVLEWKGLSSRLLVSSKTNLLANLGPVRGRTLAQLQGIQSLISSRVFGPPSSDPLHEQQDLQRLRERRNQLELELQAQVPVVALPDALELDRMMAALPEHAALVAFLIHREYRVNPSDGGAWGEEQLTAWICTPERVQQIGLGAAAPVQDAIRDLKAQLVRYRAGGRTLGEQRAPPNSVLWQRLWKPLEVPLRSYPTVLVAPDSFLAGLPLEVLESEDSTFLIERHRFHYLHDAAALARPAIVAGADQTARPEPSLLVIGDVDYDAASALQAANPEGTAGASSRLDYRGTWYPLTYTGYEADSVHYLHRRELGGEVRRLLLKGADASEARLKAELSGTRFVHLATHGFFQPEDMPSMWESAQTADLATVERRRLTGLHPGLLTGLVCAGGNLHVPDTREDGLLTAEEVAWLDLRAAELVVLSACKTGIGDTRAAEGMMSLRRAFHLAGANHVVSSLWNVDDRFAPKLMQSFYSKLWVDGLPVAEALRQAQLEMLRDNRNSNADKDGLPSTWGAFVLSGSGG